ncbi:hypothetical protein DFH27DRAFT_399538 [Peziza echinospora]|nr:hypothetical protein DFH27DRAFT_399538 [Peziza echinospora]
MTRIAKCPVASPPGSLAKLRHADSGETAEIETSNQRPRVQGCNGRLKQQDSISRFMRRLLFSKTCALLVAFISICLGDPRELEKTTSYLPAVRSQVYQTDEGYLFIGPIFPEPPPPVPPMSEGSGSNGKISAGDWKGLLIQKVSWEMLSATIFLHFCLPPLQAFVVAVGKTWNSRGVPKRRENREKRKEKREVEMAAERVRAENRLVESEKKAEKRKRAEDRLAEERKRAEDRLVEREKRAEDRLVEREKRAEDRVVDRERRAEQREIEREASEEKWKAERGTSVESRKAESKDK